MTATIKDVARAAEVSIGTVSRVLSGEPNVAPTTAERVKNAVEKLNYSRQRKRKSTATKHALARKNIAILLLGMDRSLVTLPSVASGIHGTEAALSAAGANALLVDLPRPDRLPEAFSRRQIHGVLVKGALQAGLVDNADQRLIDYLRSVPTVWILGRPQNATWGDVVESNDTEVGKLAAEYLLARGHKRIAILDPKPDHVTFGQRCASFMWHATRGGATVDQVFGEATDWKLPLKPVDDVQLVEKQLDRLLKLRSQPTAVFVPADCVAAMVYQACSRRELRIGKDLSLISCNNEIPLLTGLYPEVTTVDICAEQIGRRAVDQLVWRLERPEALNTTVAVQPHLVEGKSVSNVVVHGSISTC